MNTKLLFSLGVLGALAGAADAAPLHVDVPKDLPPARSVVTRAQVLADLHMWRLSGMEEIRRGELSQISGPRHDQAKARYEALIASPQFDVLVKQMEARPNANVLAQ